MALLKKLKTLLSESETRQHPTFSQAPTKEITKPEIVEGSVQDQITKQPDLQSIKDLVQKNGDLGQQQEIIESDKMPDIGQNPYMSDLKQDLVLPDNPDDSGQLKDSPIDLMPDDIENYQFNEDELKELEELRKKAGLDLDLDFDLNEDWDDEEIEDLPENLNLEDVSEDDKEYLKQLKDSIAKKSQNIQEVEKYDILSDKEKDLSEIQTLEKSNSSDVDEEMHTTLETYDDILQENEQEDGKDSDLINIKDVSAQQNVSQEKIIDTTPQEISRTSVKEMTSGSGVIVKKTISDDIMNDSQDNILSASKTDDRYIIIGNDVESMTLIEPCESGEKEIVAPPKYISQEEFETLIFNYRHHKYFDFSSCYKIQDFSVLRNLEEAEEIDVSDTNALNNIDFVINIPNLRVLNFASTGVYDLKPVSYCSKLEALRIDFTEVNDLEPLRNLKELTNFSCWGCLSISNLEPLKDLTNMRAIGIELSGVSTLEHLKELKKLEILGADCCKITNLSPISELKELRSLCVSDNPLMEGGVRPIEGLTKLVYMNLNECRLIDISPLRNLEKLEGLALNNNGIFDLEPLSTKKRLKELLISDNPTVDLSGIRDVKSISKLRMAGLQTPTLDHLAGLTKIVELWANGNRILKHLEPLYNLVNMEDLRLMNNYHLENIRPLVNMKNLGQLYLSKCRKIRELSPIRHMKNLLLLDITDTGIKANDIVKMKNCTTMKIFMVSGTGIISDKLRRSKIICGTRRKTVKYRKSYFKDN